MTEDHSIQPWTEPAWQENARQWIASQLDHLGILVTGPIEQPHIRPWATVMRAKTTSGNVFFKASIPAMAYEPALTQALYQWRPDCMPQVLAIEKRQGWMLSADMGLPVRSFLKTTEDLRHYHAILPLYAGVQQELADRSERLLTLGALDRRLDRLPALYQEALADTDALLIDQPDGLTFEQYHRMQDFTPEFSQICTELAGYGIPETLHNDDFHDANVFLKDGRYILSDWNETCVAHPFSSLLIVRRSLAYRLDIEEEHPAIERLVDLYLNSWKEYGSPQELRRALDLAIQTAMFCRALSWRHVVKGLPEPHRSDYAEAVPGWLQVFLEKAAPLP